MIRKNYFAGRGEHSVARNRHVFVWRFTVFRAGFAGFSGVTDRLDVIQNRAIVTSVAPRWLTRMPDAVNERFEVTLRQLRKDTPTLTGDSGREARQAIRES